MKVMWIMVVMVYFLSSCKEQTKQITEVILTSESKITCPVQNSENWKAHLVQSEDSSSTFLLTIEGEVTLPTPGYKEMWSQGLTDRMNPPRIRLQLEFTKPKQMVIQVLSTKNIKHVIETPISAFRSLIVSCGNKVLTEIKNVQINR